MNLSVIKFSYLGMTARVNEIEDMDTSSPRGSTSDDSTLVDEYNAWRQKDTNTIKLREVGTFLPMHFMPIVSYYASV